MHTKRNTVVLVDDQTAFRELLAARLSSEFDFEVTHQTDNASDGVRLAEKSDADLIMIDSMIGGRVILDTVARLSRSLPECGIVLVASLWTDGHLRQAMEIRVRGYLLKTEPIAGLIRAMRLAARGDRAFSQAIRNRLATIRASQAASGEIHVSDLVKDATNGHGSRSNGAYVNSLDRPKHSLPPEGNHTAVRVSEALAPPEIFVPPKLSHREREVLTHLAIGLSRREIGKTMHISENTVANHTAKVMAKLQIHNRVALARYAIREGLVTP